MPHDGHACFALGAQDGVGCICLARDLFGQSAPFFIYEQVGTLHMHTCHAP